ncbi:peptidyl-tRNA hydrolase, PTH1 family [Ruminococcaceae bacterium FB2012]|nr:peptidyl-tRNA hydrolase, PTH1 family [Ruminococcaceae bacterium FB2012]
MSIWDVFDRLSKKDEPQGGKPEFIIVGLGNPGIDYERTRHNAGFMAMSAVEEKLGVSVNNYKFKAKTAVAAVGGKQCLLMKPETYMNLSGEAVSQAMNFYKIPIENVLVIFDDISLDVGVMRIRRKGSAGGHNGLKSIIECCGSEDFPRIKIGVGKKPHPDYDLKDWVLGKFTEEERTKLSEIFANVLPAAELIVQGKTSEAMNKFN